MGDKEIIELAKLIATVAGGIFVFIKGRSEYRKSVLVKRAEFLDKLIAEFLKKETEIARNMLDDYVYVPDDMHNLSPVEQKANSTHLRGYLRNHKTNPIINTNEIKIRRSFDSLFDFFTKLSYYLSNKLISPKELCYFRYYIDKLQEKAEDVNDYISTYFNKNDFIRLRSSIDNFKETDC